MKSNLPHWSDISSSIVVYLVALPLCLGVAVASDAPPLSGIIAGIIGGTIVGILSGSQLSVSGPAAGLAAIVAASISSLSTLESFGLAVMIAGVFQLLFGIFRFGVIGRYVPNAVIKGMLAAIGILLILKQIPHFFGYDADPEGEESFIQPDGENTFTELLQAINHITPSAFIIAMTCALVLILFETKWLKKQSWVVFIPGPLLAVVLGVILNHLFSALHPGFEVSGDHLVALPVTDSISSLPTFIRYPDFNQWSNPEIWSVAITLAIVASLESLLSLEAVDKLDSEKRISPPNRELIAQGVGNTVSGFLGGLPVTSVIVRSSANVNAGAKSRWSAIFHGVLLFASFAFFPTVINQIPKAALAAILILTGYKLANLQLFKEYYAKGKMQMIPFIVTILAIVFTDMLIGIIIGILVGLYWVVRSNFRSAVSMYKDQNQFLIRFGRQVSFLNKPELVACLERIPKGASVLLDPLRNEFMDQDIIDAVNDFIQSSQQRGILVYIKRDSIKPREVFKDPHNLTME
jgi:MFS superfamily sulfate permease-like transporter